MASSSSATDVEASCFCIAQVEESPTSAVDGVALEETETVGAEGTSTAARSEYYSARCEAMMQSRCKFPDDVALEIEFSKSHWTEVSRLEVAPLSAEEEALNRDNMEVLQDLTKDHGPFSFFRTKSPEEPDFVLGRRIAKGGQAEIFELVDSPESLMKVFERGTSLRDLRQLWPLPVIKHEVPHCIYDAVILKDGRFAFVMRRYWGDLRKLIDQAMRERKSIDGIKGPPFPYGWDQITFTIRSEDIMWLIAREMKRLHKKGVFHRDLKASNILLDRPSIIAYLKKLVSIADFECSIGVLGTGYWRAPEILLALETREAILHAQWEKADVYSFGMTCFEVVTGQIPFDGELKNTKVDRWLVIKGKRPRLPSDLDVDVRNLITKCWDSNPILRPTFREIVKSVEEINRKQCKFRIFNIEDELPLLYCLATIEEFKEYPIALSRAMSEKVHHLGSPFEDFHLQLANGFINNFLQCTSKEIHWTSIRGKVARLNQPDCENKDVYKKEL